MENKDKNKITDKEKLEAITKLLRPRTRVGGDSSQEVTFMVRDNCELRYVISCLLRASILALESEGNLCPPRLPYFSSELVVVTLLELADNILPDDQLESYDAIEELLLPEEQQSKNK